jgi:hypothetical protein
MQDSHRRSFMARHGKGLALGTMKASSASRGLKVLLEELEEILTL